MIFLTAIKVKFLEYCINVISDKLRKNFETNLIPELFKGRKFSKIDFSGKIFNNCTVISHLNSQRIRKFMGEQLDGIVFRDGNNKINMKFLSNGTKFFD